MNTGLCYVLVNWFMMPLGDWKIKYLKQSSITPPTHIIFFFFFFTTVRIGTMCPSFTGLCFCALLDNFGVDLLMANRMFTMQGYLLQSLVNVVK